jgi:hypothetical protein
MTGVATLYGRLATSAQGSPSRSEPHGAFIASARTTRTFGQPAVTSVSAEIRRRSISTAVTDAPVAASATVSDPETRADLPDRSSGWLRPARRCDGAVAPHPPESSGRGISWG